MEMPLWLDAIVAALILAGALVATIGSVGLARMPDFYMRLHGPTKASTLGVGATLLGSMLWFSVAQGSVSVQEILITVFLFATAPVSAHMMGRAAPPPAGSLPGKDQRPALGRNGQALRPCHSVLILG